MPQIQILPRQPSPLEQLTPYISQAVSDIGQGVQQRFENQQDAKIIPAMFAPELSPMQRIELSLKLSPKRREAFYSAIRASTEGEKFGFQKERERRLAHADVLGGYDKRITQINADLKNPDTKRDERKRLSELKEKLVREQAANRTRLRGGKEPQFKYLEMQDTQPEQPSTQPLEAPAFESVRQNPEEIPSKAANQQPHSETLVQRKKTKWNPQNPEHIARREMVLKQSGGDRAKANQLLAQEFEQ